MADGWLTEVTQYLQDTPVDFLATSVIPSLGNDIVDEFRYFFAYFKSHGKFLSIRKRNSLAPVINTAASVCLAASFNEAGKFNEDLRHNEDMDLSVRMFFNGMNLGACSNARSVVKFEATHRTLAYLKRSFVKRFFSLSDSVPFLESVLPQIRTARKKSLGLKIFIICNEIAGQLGGMGGRVFPGPRNLRKKVQAGWKVKLGKKFERFHFFEGSNFYFPRKDHFFLFMDESVHLLKLPGLASSIIDPGISPALRKLNRGVALNESDISILRKLDSFEVFGETTCSN